MDASFRVLALDLHGSRLARISIHYAVVASVCIGVLGGVVVLLADHAVLLPIVISLAFGTAMFVFVRVRGKLWRSVINFISTSNTCIDGFENRALSYLGYTMRSISDNASVVDGDVLMYVKDSFDANDIRDVLDMAAERRIESVVVMLCRFDTRHVTQDATSLMNRHGVGLLDLNGVFGAVHAKMAADWQRDAGAA